MLQHLLLSIRKHFLVVAAIVLSVMAIGLPMLSKEPQQAEPAVAEPVAVPIPPPTKATLDKATTVLELFNPSDLSLTHQLNETAISQQIEQIMSTSYVLSRCKLMSEDEYRDTFRALILFAQHNKLAADAKSAEARVRKLAETAGASYSLLYSRTKCDDAKLPTIARQLLNWQRIYLRQ